MGLTLFEFEFTEDDLCLLGKGVDVFKGFSFFKLIDEAGVESLEPSV